MAPGGLPLAPGSPHRRVRGQPGRLGPRVASGAVEAKVAPRVAHVLKGFPKPAPGRPGDPGLFGPRSMVWRVNGEIAVILGAGRALLMQIAHPLVAAGVADHSDFEVDAFSRLWRTIDAVLTVAFGDTEQATAASDRVTEIHRGVVGTREGRSYRALDPDLLLWVHATLVDTALVTYERFVASLTRSERERYYLEMKRFAAAFGVPEELVPGDHAAFEGYLQETLAGLDVTDEARRLAAGVLAPPVSPAWVPVRALFREATIGLLPEPLRSGFGLAWSPGRDRALGAAAWTIRRTLPVLPSNVHRWHHARAAVGRSGPKGGG